MSSPNLEGRVAVVTGAGRGIGRAVSDALSRCGAHVVLVARTRDEIDAAAREIASQGGKASAVVTDLREEPQIVSLFDQVRDRFGRLDILVNNAGVGVYGPVAQFNTADLDFVLQVNLRGAFLCCREAMKMMLTRKAGYIINMSSVVGFKGYVNQSAYGASKHGVMGLTKSLAAEAQPHGIRVSAILPGGVDTDMARYARPDLKPSELLSAADVAETVLYLLSLSERAAVDEVYIRRRNSAPFP
jgi:3-oxoacyl-[acyl-carrier protein] reductase